ncbi:hypothetical protein NQ315_016193 [Exocentrus adspersus]|uniref:DDE Tnp4 domain-containing protein n=1 Tax=Exocentrus adspersus TaxID=1586481 RepID=A0AAV8VIR3_9CUCU|nr:hypothetical protein NQ315_016193 [Exocentrus adspersus]
MSMRQASEQYGVPYTTLNYCLHAIEIVAKIIVFFNTLYFSTGASFRSFAFSFRMGKTTVSNIISETSEAIWNSLYPAHMPIPSQNDFQKIAKRFYEIWNVPNCVGVLDGKHIRVCCPDNSSSMCFNYKGFFSIVLQALVDADYRFIHIDVGGYGKQSDGGTFKASPLSIAINL